MSVAAVARWLRADAPDVLRVVPAGCAPSVHAGGLDDGLRRWSDRLQRVRLVAVARRYLLLALGLAVGLELLALASGATERALWLVGPALVMLAGIGWGWRARPRAAAVARLLDRELSLAALVATAVEVGARVRRPAGMSARVVEDATATVARTLQGARPIGRRAPAEWTLVVVAAACLALLLAAPRNGGLPLLLRSALGGTSQPRHPLRGVTPAVPSPASRRPGPGQTHARHGAASTPGLGHKPSAIPDPHTRPLAGGPSTAAAPVRHPAASRRGAGGARTGSNGTGANPGGRKAGPGTIGGTGAGDRSPTAAASPRVPGRTASRTGSPGRRGGHRGGTPATARRAGSPQSPRRKGGTPGGESAGAARARSAGAHSSPSGSVAHGRGLPIQAGYAPTRAGGAAAHAGGPHSRGGGVGAPRSGRPGGSAAGAPGTGQPFVPPTSGGVALTDRSLVVRYFHGRRRLLATPW